MVQSIIEGEKMAQNYIAETKYGKIKVSRNAIAKAAVDSIDQLRDHVTLCSRRGKALRKNSAIELTAVDVEVIEGDIRIGLNVIVTFGSSLTATADALADAIGKALRRTLGRGPSSVTVTVRGVISKGTIAPRNVVLRREPEVQQ